MSLEVKFLKNRSIKKEQNNLNPQRKISEWMWFFGLWLAGFGTLSLVAYAIKLLIKMMTKN